MDEKQPVTPPTDQVPEYDKTHRPSVAESRKAAALGEGAEIYGDVQTAEQYGYVERGYV
jgi:hypothetical protein